MLHLNKVILIGHLWNDLEIKTLSSGSKIAIFNVTTDNNYGHQQSGNRIKKTDWHRCVVFEQQAVQRIEKLQANGAFEGRQVYIDGKLRTLSYEDSKGVERHLTEVVIWEAEGFQLPGTCDAGATLRDVW